MFGVPRLRGCRGKQNRLKTELQTKRQRKLQFLKVEDSALSVEPSALQVSPSESPPVIACYCAPFLKPEMWHIYRQIAVHLLPLIREWKNPSIVSFHGADVTVDMNKPAYREATQQMLKAVQLVLVRSESLRHAVTDLGCDLEKIEIQRTGIPLEE